MDLHVVLRAPIAAALLLALASCVSAQEDPLAQRLVGGWRFVKSCQYERPAGVEACSPITTMVEWLRFEANGTAVETRPNGPFGRYRIVRREISGGRTETLLNIGGRNMGQLTFAGDTLVLGLAYVDGPDRYFVRLPGPPR